jgi:site-specific DNA-methyltransferase (adenine-specific)
MHLARKPARLPKPFSQITTRRGTLSFYLGDCLDVLRSLTPGSISVIVTSPPYNLGIRYRSYADSLPRERYLAWTGDWIGAAARALEPAGSLFLNVGAKPTDPWTAFDVAQAARPHLQLQNTIHWIKSVAIDRGAAGASAGLTRDLNVGHYKPINSERFINDCHEFIFHFSPGGRTPLDRRAIGVQYQDASNVGRWRAGASNRRCRGNTWFIPYETIQDRDKDRPHPATFPPRVPEYCARLHGVSRVKLMADPFLGLGNSAIAAAQLGVDFIGIELDRHYLTEAVSRVKAALR